MKESPKQLMRNNYYFGKLLSVADFQLEQDYFNRKINLLGQLLIEEGIVRGLEVVRDDISGDGIIIEPGICMDDAGHLIMVPQKKTVRLEEVEGFDLVEDAEEILLSIRYQEEELGEAFSIDNTSMGMNEKTFNQIAEGYTLVLRKEESEKQDHDIELCSIHLAWIGPVCEVVQVTATEKPVSVSHKMNSGKLTMTLKENETLRSEVIQHGLGPGDFQVRIGIEFEEMGKSCIYWGNGSLLKDTEMGKIEYGVLTYPEDGTFVVVAKGDFEEVQDCVFVWQIG